MRVLCVDFDNLCRGPMAEAVLRAKAAGRVRMIAESAGVNVLRRGETPDDRAIAATAAKGYSLKGKTARAFEPGFFELYDQILAVDRYVLEALMRQRPPRSRASLRLLHPEGHEIVDPYAGCPEDFVRSLSLIEEAADGIVARVVGAQDPVMALMAATAPHMAAATVGWMRTA